MVGCSVDRPGVADDAALDLSDEFMQYNYKVSCVGCWQALARPVQLVRIRQ